MPIEINIQIYANKYANKHSFGALKKQEDRIAALVFQWCWCFEERRQRARMQMRHVPVEYLMQMGNSQLCKLF